MDTKSKEFSNRIFDLRNEILQSIKSIFTEHNLRELDVSEAGDRTYVIWWGNDNSSNEGAVSAVHYDGTEISLEVETDDSPITVYESDYALENPIWLNGVRDNILETLSNL